MKTILQFLKPGEPVWDLCCDHGYMGYAAWERERTETHFVDQVASIIESLRSKWHDPAFHFHAQSAENLPWGDVRGNIILSGVGAHTCLRILQQIPISSRLRVIISPQKDPQNVRRWLRKQGWKLVSDHVVMEKERFRQVICVESQGDEIHDFGNFLWDESAAGSAYFAFLHKHFASLSEHGTRELRHLDWPRPGPVADLQRFDCQGSLPKAKI